MTGTDLPTEMAIASEARKSDRTTRNNVETSYREELDGLLEDVDDLVDDEENAAVSTRVEQVNLLRDLIRRKATLEADILKHAGELSVAYFDAQKEMNAAIVERMQSINEAFHELQGTVEEGEDGMKLTVDGATDGEKGEKHESKKRKREGSDQKATKADDWITEVPTHDQVQRAIAMAQKGKRV